MNFLVYFNLMLGYSQRSIRVSLMYEKESNKENTLYYKSQINEVVNRYNKFLIPNNMRIEVVDLLSFRDYINTEKFSNLITLAGTEDLGKRAEEMLKLVDWHYILGASTLVDEPQTKYTKINQCKSVYVFNLDSKRNADKDLPINLINSVIDFLSNLFELEFPDFTDQNYETASQIFSERLKKSEILQNMEDCYPNEGRNSSILGIEGGQDSKEAKNNENSKILDEAKKIIEIYDKMCSKDGCTPDGTALEALYSKDRGFPEKGRNPSCNAETIKFKGCKKDEITQLNNDQSTNLSTDMALKEINNKILILMDIIYKQQALGKNQKGYMRRVDENSDNKNSNFHISPSKSNIDILKGYRKSSKIFLNSRHPRNVSRITKDNVDYGMIR